MNEKNTTDTEEIIEQDIPKKEEIDWKDKYIRR